METPTETPKDGRAILSRVYYQIRAAGDPETCEANCGIIVDCWDAVTKASQADFFVRFADGDKI